MISVKNITYSYSGQKRPVLSNFSVNIDQGRIYGLLGKNGTGKSTLLYLMSGLLRPKQGTVTFMQGGETIVATQDRKAEVLADIFLVPEEFDLPPMALNSYLKLVEPFYPRFSHEIMKKSLEAFELTDDLQLGQLSMGQKKKVYMSVALAANTRLLLMDEPTNGLDIPSKSQFRKAVAESMTDDSRTILISTHQVHDVEQLLDHILIISEEGMLLNTSVADLTDRYVFEVRPPQQNDSTAIYAEPSLQGNITMARREPGQPETTINLEILFNAVTKGLVK